MGSSRLRRPAILLAAGVAPAPSTAEAGIGVFRTSTSEWLLRDSVSGGDPELKFSFGAPREPYNDLPVTGDWDGNGSLTIGVYRRQTAQWLLRNRNSGGTPDIDVSFGTAGSDDVPVTGDWDGNGTTTIGVFRRINGRWLLRNSNSGGDAEIVVAYGAKRDEPSGDVPLTNLSRRFSEGGAPTPTPEPPPTPGPSPPPATPVGGGSVEVEAGLDCTPRGRRMPVSLTVRKRPGRAKPQVRRVVFFYRTPSGRHRAVSRTDRRAPYRRSLPIQLAPGRHRVSARIYYRRPGQKRQAIKIVSRRFVVCA